MSEDTKSLTYAGVTFDYEEWASLYPTIARFFNEKTGYAFMKQVFSLYFKGYYIVRNLEERKYLVYLLMAHVATLNGQNTANGGNPSNGATGATSLGRISDATRGSVSVRSELPEGYSERLGWYGLTGYGAEFQNAIAGYCQMEVQPGFSHYPYDF